MIKIEKAEQFSSVDAMALMSWAAILLGFKRHWISKKEIAEYSLHWLEEHPGCNLQAITLLASTENDDDESVTKWFIEMIEYEGNESAEIVLKRWQWFFLFMLNKNKNMKDEEKVVQLQEIYAEFNYPQDMAACSPYFFEHTADNIGPLQAMQNLIKKLFEEDWLSSMISRYNHPMRLSQRELDAICTAFRQYFDPRDHLWLFGSRVDSKKRGGDIDLYIETHLPVEQAVKVKTNFVVAVWSAIGEQKIDVVLNILLLKHHLPIYDVAQKQGIVLV